MMKGIPIKGYLPGAAVLELSYDCNHQCLFCSCPWYGKSSRYTRAPALDLNGWKRVIDVLTEEHSIYAVTLSGGEPLLVPYVRELIEYARTRIVTFHSEDETGNLIEERKPLDVILITNGALLTDDLISLLADQEIPISISVPGLRTYPRLVGIETDVSIPLGAIEKASRRGVLVTANITVTRLNLCELFENIGHALIAGASFLLMNRFLPGGRGLDNASILSLTASEVLEAFDIADDVLVRANRQGSIGTEIPKCLVDGRTYRNLTVSTRCSGGTDFFAVDPSGRFRPCNHSPQFVGSVFDMEAAPRSSYWEKFVKKDYLPKECLSCRLMTECDGGCREAAHIIGGCLHSHDPLWDDLKKIHGGLPLK